MAAAEAKAFSLMTDEGSIIHLLKCVFLNEEWFDVGKLSDLPIPIDVINIIHKYAEPLRLSHVLVSQEVPPKKGYLYVYKYNVSYRCTKLQLGRAQYTDFLVHADKERHPLKHFRVPAGVLRHPLVNALLRTSSEWKPFCFLKDGKWWQSRRTILFDQVANMVIDPVYLHLLNIYLKREVRKNIAFRVVQLNSNFCVDIKELRSLFTQQNSSSSSEDDDITTSNE